MKIDLYVFSRSLITNLKSKLQKKKYSKHRDEIVLLFVLYSVHSTTQALENGSGIRCRNVEQSDEII